jgi:hypothetical protein
MNYKEYTGLSSEERTKLEEEIKGYSVKLDSDPTSLSLEIIYKHIATLKAYIERVGVIYTDAIKNEKFHSIILLTLEEDFERKVENLLINDESVRNQKSESLRDAAAHLKLSKEYEEIKEQRIIKSKAEVYLSTIKIRLDDLKHTYDALSRQFSVIQEMTNLGILKKVVKTPQDVVRLTNRNYIGTVEVSGAEL